MKATTKKKKKTSKKNARTLYSKGQLNYLIDSTVHPLIGRDTSFVLVDEFLHMLVERSPSVSLRKFIRYSLPQIIRKVTKDR